jgi:ribosomal RNA-processing protein 12
LPPTSHTLLDLIIALSVHLPRSTFAPLFVLASTIITNPAILATDPQLIKKAYKLIPRLATSPTGAEALKTRNAELQTLILSTTDKTPVPARRDRLLAINTLISFLPISDLHFIPSVLGEVVLACKDSNEKARTAGFESLLAATGRIASPENPTGTMIRNRLVSHMPDDAPDAPATLEEVFTMVSAGLAGVAPHMIAASITALSRLLFEYHDSEELGRKMKEELIDTVVMFLESNNREIVRAVLGFVKVMVVVLPLDMLEPRCETIIPGLMVWSKENKGRLRVKVKGILERLIRRFGSTKVENWVGPEDRKMVVNIRKRRERSRRKKKGEDGTEIGSDEEDNEDARAGKHDNAFDEAVYGSDEEDDSGSELEGSDDGDVSMSGVSHKSKAKTAVSTTTTGGKRRDRAQFIRQNEEDDEPLDLLDPKSMASISTSRRSLPSSSNFLGSNKKKSKATYNEDGKLVFATDTYDQPRQTKKHQLTIPAEEEDEAAQGDAINAYLDAVDGPDAVRRGQKGKLKVKSGMQRSARQNNNNNNGAAVDELTKQ